MIDAAGHQLRLADGTVIGQAQLVLATGALPRRPPLPDADADSVYYPRTHEDAGAIRSWFGENRGPVIISGGWIGLEDPAPARRGRPDGRRPCCMHVHGRSQSVRPASVLDESDQTSRRPGLLCRLPIGRPVVHSAALTLL